MSSNSHTPSAARRIAGIGLLVAAAGIPIQIAGGADYPAVPPGLLILTAAGALMFVRWRWAPLPAMAVAVLIGIGGIVTPNLRDQLADPAQALAFVGSVVQVVGLVTGLVCGAAAVRETWRGQETAAPAGDRSR